MTNPAAEALFGKTNTGSKCQAVRESLMKLPNDVDHYSNPSNLIAIPFPTSLAMRTARFDIDHEEQFHFLGRVAFKNLFEAAENLNTNKFPSWTILVYGTPGFGKSYILAALAALLTRRGNRVVYLPRPDCLILNAVATLQMALRYTFADYGDEILSTINKFRSFKEVSGFLKRYSAPLYFIVDQFDSLDATDNTKESCRRLHAKALLESLFCHNYVIQSASANVTLASKMEDGSYDDIAIRLNGGFTPEEMQHWWQYFELQLPKLAFDDKMRIEHFTGRNPYLLRPLLQLQGAVFADVEDDFWKNEAFVFIPTAMDMFDAAAKEKYTAPQYQNRYLQCMSDFVHGERYIHTPKFYDHRYFYIDPISKQGVVSCGIALEGMTAILRRTEVGLFLKSNWRGVMSGLQNNPAMLYWFCKQLCISSMAVKGLVVGSAEGLSFSKPAIHQFREDHVRLLDGFYIPQKPNCLAIDCVHISRDSLEGYTFSVIFVWICENEKTREKIAKQMRAIRADKSTLFDMEYERVYLTLANVNDEVAKFLAFIRREQGQLRDKEEANLAGQHSTTEPESYIHRPKTTKRKAAPVPNSRKKRNRK